MSFNELRRLWSERDHRYSERQFGRLSDGEIASIRAFRLAEVERTEMSTAERVILVNEVKGWTPWYQAR